MGILGLSQGMCMPLTVNNRDFVLVVTGFGNKKQLWLSEIKGGGLFLFVFKERERRGRAKEKDRIVYWIGYIVYWSVSDPKRSGDLNGIDQVIQLSISTVSDVSSQESDESTVPSYVIWDLCLLFIIIWKTQIRQKSTKRIRGQWRHTHSYTCIRR